MRDASEVWPERCHYRRDYAYSDKQSTPLRHRARVIEWNRDLVERVRVNSCTTDNIHVYTHSGARSSRKTLPPFNARLVAVICKSIASSPGCAIQSKLTLGRSDSGCSKKKKKKKKTQQKIWIHVWRTSEEWVTRGLTFWRTFNFS